MNSVQIDRDAVAQHAGCEGEPGELQHLHEIERQRTLGQNPQHAERLPAQAERILVAGRHQADAVDADQRVELVGRARRRADVVLRAANRWRSAGDSALRSRAPRLRLHRRAAHSTDPSCPAARGTRRPCRVSRSALASHAARSVCVTSALQLLGDRAGELADALHALELAAELVVIDHGAEPLARDRRAASCDPGRRRTSRRPGGRAARARCRR